MRILQKIKNSYQNNVVSSLFILRFTLIVAGVLLGLYFNFMWFITIIADFVNHIQESPIDGIKVAYDVGKFCIRGLVFLVTMLAFQVPQFLLSLLIDNIRKNRSKR